jgi:hypothetical protein
MILKIPERASIPTASPYLLVDGVFNDADNTSGRASWNGGASSERRIGNGVGISDRSIFQGDILATACSD